MEGSTKQITIKQPNRKNKLLTFKVLTTKINLTFIKIWVLNLQIRSHTLESLCQIKRKKESNSYIKIINLSQPIKQPLINFKISNQTFNTESIQTQDISENFLQIN